MAADQVVQLIFRANASSARGDVRGLGTDLDNIGQRGRAAGQNVESGFDRARRGADRSQQALWKHGIEIDGQNVSIKDMREQLRYLETQRDKAYDPSSVMQYNRQIEDLQGNLRKMQNLNPEPVPGMGAQFGMLAAKVGLAYGSVQLVRRGFERMVEVGSEFESKLADLEAITGITGDRLDRLGDEALTLSKQYGESAANIIEADKLVASQLAQKIDFGTEEGFRQLQEVTEQAVILKNAAGIDLADAVDAVTSSLNQFNLEAASGNRVINTLAAGAKFGAAEVGDIAAAFRDSGAAAESAAIGIETNNAAIQVLAQNALRGSRAGNQLRNIYLRLQTRSEELAEHGLGNVDLKANGLTATLQQLNPLLDDAGALQAIFGEEAFNAAAILIQNAAAVEDLEEKVTGTNVAYEQAETRMDTYDNATDRLAATMDSKLIPAFTATGGAMVGMINYTIMTIENTAQLVDWFNRLLDPISHVRDEVDQNERSMREFNNTVKDVRTELAEYYLDNELTIDQERELRESFDASTESLRARATAIFDDTHEMRQRRSELQKQISELEEIPDYARGPDITPLKNEYEALDLSIKSNQETIEEMLATLRNGDGDFDTFIRNLELSREAQAENEDQNNQTIVSVKSLTDTIKENEQAINSLITKSGDFTRADQRQIDSLLEKNKALQAEIDFRNELVGLGVTLDSGSVDINEDVFSFADEEHQREKARHLERMSLIDEEKLAKLNAEEETTERAKVSWDQYVEAVGSGVTNIMGFFSTLAERRIKDLEDERNQALGAIDAELNNRELSENRRRQLIKQREAVEQDYQQKIQDEKRKQFRLDQAAALSEALINTAVSVSKVLANPIMAGIVAAGGAAQVAIITAQPNPYERGGWIGGRRHRDGGTIIEAERDEFITNRDSARVASGVLDYTNRGPSAAREVQAMFDTWRSGYGSYQSGGSVGGNSPVSIGRIASPTPNNLAEDIAQALKGVVVRAEVAITELRSEMNRFQEKERSVGN